MDRLIAIAQELHEHIEGLNAIIENGCQEGLRIDCDVLYHSVPNLAFPIPVLALSTSIIVHPEER